MTFSTDGEKRKQLLPNHDPLSDFIFSRLSEQKPVDICISGPRGCGKTWSLLTVGCQNDALFTADSIANSVSGLLKVVKRLKSTGITSGRVIAFEEAQDQMYNKRSQTIEAVELIRLLSKYRYMGLIFIVSTPIESQLNRDFIDYFNVRLVSHRLDAKNSLAIFKLLIKDDETGHWCKSRLWHSGEKLEVGLIGFRPPPPDIVRAYEEMKDKYVVRSIDQSLAEIDIKQRWRERYIRRLA